MLSMKEHHSYCVRHRCIAVPQKQDPLFLRKWALSMSTAMEFCSECNNLLYPLENVEKRVLMNSCRTCGYLEEAKNPCVYVRRVETERDELARINTDVISDPTMPRTNVHPCPACGSMDAVYFQGRLKSAEGKMSPFYVCRNRNCLHRWT
uniref:DNA-directed RNA polymerase subunit n=2 Tax=Parascaris univalens TaxID=6257 RepID=A0A915A210_PARUN